MIKTVYSVRGGGCAAKGSNPSQRALAQPPPTSCGSSRRPASGVSEWPHAAAARGPRPIFGLHVRAAPRPEIPQASSLDEVDAGLRSVGYLPGGSTALVSLLATRLGKPILVEGPAGVGKTELAKALAKFLDRTLIRLQCYEGLDEAKALYEWNYRKQLLAIQATEKTDWDATKGDIFGEEFLLERPLMTAIASPEPVVLLIDEIDKTDQEFEAMLLEVLSDFQISIPEP